MFELREYEGLIHNYAELADELGVDIEGCTRREREERLVAAAYEAWGTAMGAHINGQFAIIMQDTENGGIFCTRDPLGAELLFYYLTADGRLLTATQISDLFDQPGFVRELNRPLVQYYLAFNYVPGEQTLFKGVCKLEPGGYLTFDAQGLQLGRYWELSFEPDETKTLDEWADAISQTMDASLDTLCDDGQVYDSFLSSGVDSSFIMAKSQARTGFCAVYEEQGSSEEPDARATAAELGRSFEAVTISFDEYLRTIDEYLLAFEQPTSDPASLALFVACKHVRERSELCLSGEGSDEFFAGYSAQQPKPWYRKLLTGPYSGCTYIMNGKEQARFVKEYHPECSTRAFIEQRTAPAAGYDELTRNLYTDLRTYFEGSILFNSTKISRGTGLDIRMPFCDLRMFDIARRLPARFKVNQGQNKLALRTAAARVLPEGTAFRKKLGFPVPVRSWLATPAFLDEITRAFRSEAAAELLRTSETDALLAAFKGEDPGIHRRWYRTHKAGLWRYVWTVYLLIRWYELFFGKDAAAIE